jgi:hypothetical protein
MLPEVSGVCGVEGSSEVYPIAKGDGKGRC